MMAMPTLTVVTIRTICKPVDMDLSYVLGDRLPLIVRAVAVERRIESAGPKLLRCP
ncbi:hypothetical protein GCM10027417_16590 [Glutamicibacter endophyticus]